MLTNKMHTFQVKVLIETFLVFYMFRTSYDIFVTCNWVDTRWQ
jgi:hypothetical protein